MKHPNIRWIVSTAAALSLLVSLACGADSEPAPTTSALPTPVDPPTPPPPPTILPAAPPTPPPPPAVPPAPEVGTRVGDRAPEFTLTLSQDQRISSTDLVAQGKPVFILFHATW